MSTEPMTGEIRKGFVSESIRPLSGSFDAAAMARGEPGLPREFEWRDRTWRVATVLESWKTSGPCRNGASERYVRRHWSRIRTECGLIVTLYVDRQPKAGSSGKRRWWLFTVDSVPSDSDGAE